LAKFSSIQYYKKHENQQWFKDLLHLSDDELVRIQKRINEKYEFAKDAWYIPLSGDKRCPIMIAKDIDIPQSLENMASFHQFFKDLERQYKSFIQAWDNNEITPREISNAIDIIIESRKTK
jgi:hypothetical protein